MNGWHLTLNVDSIDVSTINPALPITEPATVGELLGLDPYQLDAYYTVHEAGHTVLARAAGGLISEVALTHRPDEAGHVIWANPTDGTGSWDDVAAVHAAGEQAATRWLRENGLHTPVRAWASELGSLGDRNMARRWTGADVVTDNPVNPHDWRRLSALARDRLDGRWGEVEQLAADLQQHRHLTPANYPLNEPGGRPARRRRGLFRRRSRA